MTYQDYYQVLGVSRAASTQEITKAYRGLARRFHPDVSKEPDAEARFKQLGEAYEVIKDPKKRRLYDKWGPHWKAISEGRQPPPGGPGSSEASSDFGPFGFGANVEDLRSIFETVFAGANQPGRRRRRRTQTWREDQQMSLELPVSIAYQGGPRELQLVDPGTGAKRRLTVHVPPQVRHGQRIRLAGQAGGGKGDLFLEIRLGSDEQFRIEGDDLYTRLRVSPSEAVLGASAVLPTLDGNVKVKVPPGSSSGRSIRLKERGYPGRGGRRGDLYAEIQVVVPEAPSDEERALYEQLAEISSFEPR